MFRILPIIVLFAASGAASIPAAGAAQTQRCYPLTADSIHSVLRDNVLLYAADTTAADFAEAGAALGYPRVPADSVVLVRDEAVCDAAAQAYAAAAPTPAFAPLSGTVYVFRVGAGHYVVVDPEYQSSQDIPLVVVFTSSWAVVSKHW